VKALLQDKIQKKKEDIAKVDRKIERREKKSLKE
jgi:hypothetical protein